MTIFSLESYGAVFTDVLTGIISTMTGMHFSTQSNERDDACDELNGMMSLNGNRSGFLVISASRDDMRDICTCMLGINAASVTQDDEIDCLCELVNMTAGNAKLRFNDTKYMFSLTPPFVLSGKDINITTKNKVQMYSGLLGDGNLSLKLKIIY